MLKRSKQSSNKKSLAPLNKATLLLAGILTLGLTVGCSGESKSDTAAEPSVSESAPATTEPVTEPATETAEPEVAPEEEAEPEQPEAATESAESEPAAAAAPLAADAGAKLYEAKCKLCHEKGLLNAPKFANPEDWAPRIAKGKETLYKHSAEGFNAMPAQAADGVTVEQVHAAVDYMVDNAS
ncbi:c-type cytochrome [Psychrobacter sanguinis]|uniref:c-type cytochrome n=1 Tax=Psychrobacter sanguinis TaxID=861445 RepID=UPI002A7640DA|nr:c-type cytochrome [Psychrobacter sanguinis]MDY3307336.1 c-type cytochrome [Psychrobacter sanguinis]